MSRTAPFPPRFSPYLRAALTALVGWLALAGAARAEIPPGKSDFVFADKLGNEDRPIRVWCYRPDGFGADSPVVFVMHGTLRNGETYREPWLPIAARHHCLVVVPEFSTQHYPGSRIYHFGNLRDADGRPVEEAKWTFSAVEHLFDHVKKETGSRRERYHVFGHSAGSQFVHRMVLFKPGLRMARAVAANAGSYTMPSFETEYPYGLGKSGVPEARLRQALAVPMVVLLGEKDTDPNDRQLPRDAGARVQGAHRFERGQNFYRAARAEAKRLGVELNWALETVPDVGHDNARMAPAAARALFDPAPRPLDARFRSALAEVDRLAAAELAKDGLGGCTVGVVAGPDLVWAKSYGLADVENKVPAANDHVYRVGSITKQFTGLMLLRLAEQKKARLSDPAEKYFPEINRVKGRHPDAPPVTLGQLATMTSGLERDPDNLPTYLRGPVADWEKVLVAALGETSYRYEPGGRYHYSNVGYAVLGAALARAAKKPFVEYLREEVFTPLGMADTAFEPTEAMKGRLAKGYTPREGNPDGRAAEREHSGRGFKVPAGCLYTTAGDLGRFLAFELGHGPKGVLERAALEANFGRVHSADGKLTFGYGVGFMARRRGAWVLVGHTGSVAGYNAAAYVERTTQTGVVVLRNVGGGRFNSADLCYRALELVAESRR